MKFKEKLGKEMLICDGAMGTLLIENGLKAGELPEMWNIEHPDILYKIHKQYVDAGADIISANTFGANRLKLDGTGHSVEEIITEGVNIAKKAAQQAKKQVQTLFCLKLWAIFTKSRRQRLLLKKIPSFR